MAFTRTTPGVEVSIAVSDRWNAVTRQDRNWNRIARESIIAVLEKHHQTRIPRHFDPSAHFKYGYMRRSKATRDIKQYKLRIDPYLDLVKIGDTVKTVRGNRKITIRGGYGSAGNPGSMRATLHMGKFPFPIKRIQTGIGTDQMRKEIATVTSEEAQEMAHQFRRGVISRLNTMRGAQIAGNIYRKR
jgi:hypothetical protein